MIESQRRLAELGLFRRVRITELPRTGSLTRDVLVDLEEAATTTIDYGGGVEVGRIGGADDEGFAIDELDIGAARLLRDQPAELVGQEPFGDAVWQGHRPARPGRARHSASCPKPTRPRSRAATASTTTVGCSRSVSHAPLAPPAMPSSRPSSSRRRRTSFWFNRKGLTSDYARRIRAPITVTGRYTFDYTKVFEEAISVDDQLLIDRLFPQVRLSKVFGARAARFARRRARSAAWVGARRGHLGGRQGAGLRSGVREELRSGFRVSPPAGPRRGGRRGRAPRRGGRLCASGAAGARNRPPSPRTTVAARAGWGHSRGPSIASRRFPRSSASCRRASGSSPVATPPCAALPSIAWAAPRHSMSKDSPRAATPWRFSTSKRARRTGRTSSSCGSSTPATCSGA